MIILETPYTSPELSLYLAEAGIPVLDNEAAQAAPASRKLTLVAEEAFIEMLNSGRRLYTTSENALGWVLAHAKTPSLLHGVNVMKDKFRLRETLRPLYPEYFFRETHVDDLPDIDPDSLPYPIVLKPVVGFFSVGVHVVHDRDGWRAAVADILAGRGGWGDSYSESVVGNERFILEEYIAGDEYAVDAYYDANGEPVIVDILRHDFASASDVKDRLYYTSPELIRERLEEFTAYLVRVGSLLRLRDFPLHLEIRLSQKGIVPIEFNPLRFAGWCTTDVALFAYGLRTYQYYLEDRRPDWDALLDGKEGNIYSMVILDTPRDVPDGKRLDFDAVGRTFTEVLHQRRMEGAVGGVQGFLFTRTPADRPEELDRIVRLDLNDFFI